MALLNKPEFVFYKNLRAAEKPNSVFAYIYNIENGTPMKNHLRWSWYQNLGRKKHTKAGRTFRL